MPYLTDTRKRELDEGLAPSTPGDLTYRLTIIAINTQPDEWLDYMKGEIERYMKDRQVNFALLSGILGCIAAARQEWCRRGYGDPTDALWWVTVETAFYTSVIGPYEDQKCAANGDVYPPKEEPIPCA